MRRVSGSRTEIALKNVFPQKLGRAFLRHDIRYDPRYDPLVAANPHRASLTPPTYLVRARALRRPYDGPINQTPMPTS